MKTTHSKSKRPVKKISVIRFTLVIAILFFSANMVKSQNSTSDSDYKPAKSTVKKAQPAINAQANKTISTENNMVIIPKKLAEHAPEFNDPDYEAKKIEWMEKYPDEYNALQKKTSNCSPHLNTGTDKAGTIIPQKVAEHAPDLNDPDYETKKTEWIKNYPEEYKSVGGVIENGTHTHNSLANPGTTPPTTKLHIKVAEHAPYMDAPDYDVKKAEWIQNYPEEYEASIKESSKSNNGTNSFAPPEIKKPATKVAEHAPYSDDPDYEAKKAEWIKKYPQEYNVVNNKPANSVKNSPAGQGVQTPATAIPVNDATRK